MIDTMDQQSREISDKIAVIRTLEDEMEKKMELFQACQAELVEKSSELLDTKDQLTSTSASLHQTKELLDITATDRDEKKFLLDAHVTTEEKLLQQGRDLVTTKELTTNHISLLHEKIDRTRGTEQRNAIESEAFEASFEQQVTEIQSFVGDFRTDFEKRRHKDRPGL